MVPRSLKIKKYYIIRLGTMLKLIIFFQDFLRSAINIIFPTSFKNNVEAFFKIEILDYVMLPTRFSSKEYSIFSAISAIKARIIYNSYLSTQI